MNALIEFFRANGTKVIGYITTAAAFFAFADPTLINDLLGGKWQRWALLVSGLLTALRGHTNTAAIKDDIRVEEKAKEIVKVDKAIDAINASQLPNGESP
jgi:hypothetical protein